ncbi:MAG TPA: alcohol dehydrogenase catalytic domain-containing protein [Longimicrobiales bacterium]|nr:alcohol dehydrogenase catalytic domain-containing protein [Longimicrobiales bacterium]
MKAAVFEQFGEPLEVRDDWPEPECGPRDVVLKVDACGVCRSDHTIWNGGVPWMGIVPELPMVLGHEYCGTIEEVGDQVAGFGRGDRVVAPFNHSCGHCEQCATGHQNICSDLQLPGMHYTGGYAEYTKVSRADVNLVHLPEDVPSEVAAGMGCRYITSYHGIVDRAQVHPGEWVAVFACGGVGLAAVNVASAMGANVIAVSRSPEKLALAEKVGALHTVTAGPDAPDEIHELTGGGAHVSVDALGSATTAIPALLSLRAGGRHLRLGVSNQEEQGKIEIPVDMLTFAELSMVGSFGMQAARFPEMLRMVEAGKLTPELLVGETIALEDAGDVLAAMDDYDTVAMSVITEF